MVWVPPVTFADGWQIPEPDLVVSIPAPFTVPAEGVIEYQRFVVDPGFQEDKWIRAVQIRPGNGALVHHALVQLQPPGKSESVLLGTLGSVILATTIRGTPPLILPDGMAKLVPAGWKLVFIIHYTPIGTVQTDQTSMGLVFADPKSVCFSAARTEHSERMAFGGTIAAGHDRHGDTSVTFWITCLVGRYRPRPSAWCRAPFATKD